MKTINYLSALTLMLLSFSVLGQDEKPVKRISITDVQIYAGMLTERDINGTLTDFKALAPQSVLLNKDMSGFSQPSGSATAGDPGISIMIGIQFRDKQKTAYKANPLLRLGFNYSTGTTISSGMHNSYSSRYDTLTSSQTGEAIYVDSVLSESYGMFYSSEQLRFDGSLIFRTNPDARWSIYTGLGITAGISINARTNIDYSMSSRKYVPSYAYSNTSEISNPNLIEGEAESHQNKTNFSFSTYVPLGVDFRIGKSSEFWERVHLFYELKPAISITSIPELYTITNASFQHGLGLRVAFN